MAQRVQDRRAEETEEQRNSRLSDMAQRGQERRAEETEEQRNRRLAVMRQRSQQRRAEDTEEQKRIRFGLNITFTLETIYVKKINRRRAYEN
ncbi:hypothetical protein AVEN_140812-1 [Araneus ventricosus]|uniref:STPR domain-containing protein n=1 Tax=Araneus ventricosus TaxID=182803 RepID=A0A4Y2TF31_ARAVE|nr:hypothetical protein AVEN_140812-1 [Araneus ventricosus]